MSRASADNLVHFLGDELEQGVGAAVDLACQVGVHSDAIASRCGAKRYESHVLHGVEDGRKRSFWNIN